METSHTTQQGSQEQSASGVAAREHGRSSRRLLAVGAGAVVLAAVALFAIVSSGFGSTSASSRTVPAPGQVSVSVTAPTSNSVIASDQVTVRGTVVPANSVVQVQGKPAAVGNGVFTGSATLHGGKTTVDVVASYPGAAPGATSIVIARQSSSQQPARVRVVPVSPAVIVAPNNDSGVYGGTGTKSCGQDLSVGPNTTCPFAEDVRAAYESHGPGVVEAYSPVTGQTYAMSCSAGSSVVCTGANNASVYFPTSTAGDYSAPQGDYAEPSSGSRTGTTGCGGGLSVGPNTTCPFAAAVRSAYESHGPGIVTAYSSVTGRTYSMSCSAGSPVVCTGGNNASVYIP
jgi:hypothetical protein